MGKAIDVWLTQVRAEGTRRVPGAKGMRGRLARRISAPRRPRQTIVRASRHGEEAGEGPPCVSGRGIRTMAPGEPRVMKRPIEANAPRSPRRPAPTITLDEPARDGKKKGRPRRSTHGLRPARDGYAARRAVREAGRDEATRRADGGAPRREGPTITHGDRIAMDLMKPGPAIPVTGAGPGGSQPMMLAKPGSEASGPAEALPCLRPRWLGNPARA